MMERIPEKDWKYFHSLQESLIQRYCGETLLHIRNIASGKSGNNLRRYQDIWQYIEKREKTLVRVLNDFRRSNAVLKIIWIRKLGLFTDAEFDEFSEEAKSIIKNYEAW